MASNRVSKSEVLLDKMDDYEYLYTYITKLESNYLVKENLEYSNLVNYSKNEVLAYHNWFKYKEGYSAELVSKLLSEFRYQKGDRILDPFCGSGTTLLVAKNLGLNSIGFDVNPVASFIAEAKTKNYSIKDINEVREVIQSLDNIQVKFKAEKPKLSIVDKIFDEIQLEDLLKLKGYIDSYKDRKIYYLLKVSYLSILEVVSNTKKDGNGIKYIKVKRNYDVIETYKTKLTEILNQVENNKNDNLIESKVFNESFINSKNYNLDPFKHIIFSPPYANCFDYSAVYKVELWMGDFVLDYKDFKKLRSKAIRSHVNGSLNKNITNDIPIVKWISERLSSYELWDKKIPIMLQGYFDDMYKVLQICYDQQEIGGKCAIVVANSSYKGYLVPTDILLAKIGEKIGYKVKYIEVCRYLKTSSQQQSMHVGLKKYLRESLIVLEKE